MPLTEIWKAAPQTVLGMLLPAVVNIATNGDRLRDGSAGSNEFREFLTEVDSDKLAEYATHCIENGFNDSGQVLQEIINEMGRRLGLVLRMVDIGEYVTTLVSTAYGRRTARA